VRVRFYALYLLDTRLPAGVYTHIGIIDLVVSLVYMETDVFQVVAIVYSVVELCMSTLLLIGILKERPVLMLPAMVIMVCASEFYGVVLCKT